MKVKELKNLIIVLFVAISTFFITFVSSNILEKTKTLDIAFTKSTLKIISEKSFKNKEIINDLLDSIPNKSILINKNDIISSNLAKNQKDRIEFAKEKQNIFSNTIRVNDLKLIYESNSEELITKKIIVSSITTFLTVFLSFIALFLIKRKENESSDVESEVYRLKSLVESLQLKDDKVSQKLSTEMPEDPEEIKKYLKKILKEKDLIIEKKSQVEKLFEKSMAKEIKLNKEIESLKVFGKKAKADLNEFEDTKKTLESKNNKIKELENELDEKNKDLSKSNKKVSKIKTDLDKKSDLEVELTEKDNEIKKLKISLKNKDKNNDDTLEKSLKVEIEQKNEKVKLLKDQLKKANEEIGTFDKLGYETLKTENKSQKLSIKELKERLEQSKSKVDNPDSERLIKDLKKQLSLAKDEIKSLDTSKVSLLTSENKRLKDNLQSIKLEKSDQDKSIKYLQSKLEEISKNKEIKTDRSEDLADDLQETKFKLADALDKLKEVGNIAEIKAKKNEYKKRYQETKEELKIVREDLNNKKDIDVSAYIDKNKKQADDIKKLKQQLSDAHSTMTDLGKVDVSDLKQKLKKRESSLSETKLQLDLSQQMVNELKAGRSPQEINEIVDSHKLIGKLRQDNQSLDEKVKWLEQKISSVEGEYQGDEITELEITIENERQKQQRLEDEMDKIKVLLKTKEELLDNLPEDSKEYEELVEKIALEKNTLEAKMESLKSKVVAKEEQIKNFKLELADKNSELTRVVQSHNKKSAVSSENVAKLNEMARRLKKEQIKTKKMAEQLAEFEQDSDAKKLKNYKKKAKEFKEALENKEDSLNRLQKDNQRMFEKNKDLQLEVENLKGLPQKIKSELNIKYNEQIRKLENNLKNEKSKVSKLAQLQAEEANSEVVTDLKEKLADNDKKLKEMIINNQENLKKQKELETKFSLDLAEVNQQKKLLEFDKEAKQAKLLANNRLIEKVKKELLDSQNKTKLIEVSLKKEIDQTKLELDNKVNELNKLSMDNKKLKSNIYALENKEENE